MAAFVSFTDRCLREDLSVERKMVKRHGCIVTAVVQEYLSALCKICGSTGQQHQFLIARVAPAIPTPKWAREKKHASKRFLCPHFAHPLDENRGADRMADENNWPLHRSQLFFEVMLPLFIGCIFFVWQSRVMNLVLWAKCMREARGKVFVHFVSTGSSALNQEDVRRHDKHPFCFSCKPSLFSHVMRKFSHW